MIATVHLYWLAGLIEGEGCVSSDRGRTTLQVQMTDEDVIRRAHEYAGIGTVSGPHQRSWRRKNGTPGSPTWCWSVRKQADLIPLLMQLLPLMGRRRFETIKEKLGV